MPLLHIIKIILKVYNAYDTYMTVRKYIDYAIELKDLLQLCQFRHKG